MKIIFQLKVIMNRLMRKVKLTLRSEESERFKNSLERSNINGFVNVARPIEIINARKQNEFVLINEYNLNTTSLPLRKKTLTDSFRDYLYSSIKILRDSYHYISNNSV